MKDNSPRFLQIHALTVFPPSNLNRDDVGRPKTAVFGGAERIRVSSQCLKRAWRTSDLFRTEFADHTGVRTREFARQACQKMLAAGVAKEVAFKTCEGILAAWKNEKEKKDNGKQDPKKAEADAKKKEKAYSVGLEDPEFLQHTHLVHLSQAELARIDALVSKVAKGAKVAAADFNLMVEGAGKSVDIALFGRMLAEDKSMSVDAAVQVSHALGVQQALVEDDYYTAVDDLNRADDSKSGAGHLGGVEYAASTLYLYACLDRAHLLESLGGDRDLCRRAMRVLVQAMATVTPSGHRNKFGHHALASYMLAEAGSQQPRTLALAFLQPVEDPDPLRCAISRLEETQKQIDRAYGSCADKRVFFDVPAGRGTLQDVLAFVQE